MGYLYLFIQVNLSACLLISDSLVTGGGFESSGGRRSDGGLKSEKHRDWRDVSSDVGGRLAASDEDDDRHRASRGSRQAHKAAASQQGNFLQTLSTTTTTMCNFLQTYLHCGSKKTRHQTVAHNFTKY